MPYNFYFVSSLKGKDIGQRGVGLEQSGCSPDIDEQLYFHENIGFRYELAGLSLEEASVRPWLT